jgi:hypothetical protein
MEDLYLGRSCDHSALMKSCSCKGMRLILPSLLHLPTVEFFGTEDFRGRAACSKTHH